MLTLLEVGPRCTGVNFGITDQKPGAEPTDAGADWSLWQFRSAPI
jgi:hypothetical protein